MNIVFSIREIEQLQKFIETGEDSNFEKALKVLKIDKIDENPDFSRMNSLAVYLLENDFYEPLRKLKAIKFSYYWKDLPDCLWLLTELEILEAIAIKDLSHNLYRIKNLKKLKYLNFFDNIVDHLPSEIGELINLEWINLYDTNVMYIPDEISNLKRLQNLVLCNTPIAKDSKRIKELRIILPHTNIHIVDN